MSIQSENAKVIAEAFINGPLDPDIITRGKDHKDYADRLRIKGSIDAFKSLPFNNDESIELIKEAYEIILRDHEIDRKDIDDYMVLFRKIHKIQLQRAEETLSPEIFKKVKVQMDKITGFGEG